MADPGLSEQQIAQLKAMLAAAAGKADAVTPEWIASANTVADFIAKAAWPIIAAVLLWFLYPALAAIIRSRSFSIKVAGMEVSVQDATEQLRTQIDDLQRQVIALRTGAPAATTTAAASSRRPKSGPDASPSPASARRRILWVDDNMSNNAFQIAQLNDAGITVVKSSSTADAMAILKGSAPFDAVISDMGRREQGAWQGEAGLGLLREMRSNGHDEPFIVYSSRAYATRHDAEVRKAGGDGATSSPVELLEWVRRKVPADPAAAK